MDILKLNCSYGVGKIEIKSIPEHSLVSFTIKKPSGNKEITITKEQNKKLIEYLKRLNENS